MGFNVILSLTTVTISIDDMSDKYVIKLQQLFCCLLGKLWQAELKLSIYIKLHV